jgi:hypothetical protein
VGLIDLVPLDLGPSGFLFDFFFTIVYFLFSIFLPFRLGLGIFPPRCSSLWEFLLLLYVSIYSLDFFVCSRVTPNVLSFGFCFCLCRSSPSWNCLAGLRRLHPLDGCSVLFPVSALCSILICIEHECVRLIRSKETLCSICRHTVVVYKFLSPARAQPILSYLSFHQGAWRIESQEEREGEER